MATASPRNNSMHESAPRDSSVMRAASRIYGEQLHQLFIRRLLKNISVPQGQGRSISIQQQNGEPFAVNPPYGFLPFAMLSAKGEISPEALKKAIDYCGAKRNQYEKSGDYYRCWLFAQRQSMLAGVLEHLVSFTLA
jgi:hypothetical protein